MRDACQLALISALAGAFIAAASTADAQAPPPAWQLQGGGTPGFEIAPTAATVAPTPSPGARLDESDLALRGVFCVSFPPSDTLDEALVSRGYSATSAALGFDFALTVRTVGPLFLGARVGSHWRMLDASPGSPASEQVLVSGLDLVAVAELRFAIGSVELTPDVGIGIAYAELVQTAGSVTRAAPRASLGTSLSMWLSGPLRLVGRLGWELYPVNNVNRFGHDINLGGTRLDVGLEWRDS